MPVKDLNDKIIFQADSIEEIENYIETLRIQNKYNLWKYINLTKLCYTIFNGNCIK